jgi:predicted HTH domain antitoxin
MPKELVLNDPMITKALEAISKTGLYKNETEFLEDAVRTLLAARRDVRIEVACYLYDAGEISIGKACEIVGVDIEEMKEIFHKRGIRRKTSDSPEETGEMVKSSSLFRSAE